MTWLQHWLAIHTGSQTNVANRPFYNFFSGFGSIVIPMAPQAIMSLLILRKLNCDHAGCWGLTLHRTANGHRLCKKCLRKPMAELDLHEVHGDHQ